MEQLGNYVSPSVASSGDNQSPALLEPAPGSSCDSMTFTPPNSTTQESKQGVSSSQKSASASAPNDIESKESSALPVVLPPFSSSPSRLDSSATNGRAVVQQFSILFQLPAELLERLALEVALLELLGPPKDLIALLCTCKRVHDFLAFGRCYNLFARIFKAKFDISAVRRGFGPESVRSSSLALQLKKYCTTLQDIRGGNIYSSNIHDVLRTAFFMAMEDDGRNSYQLAWAGLDRFVDRFVRTRLCEDAAVNSGWPAENNVNALALWLMWFTTTRGKFAAPCLLRDLIVSVFRRQIGGGVWGATTTDH
jgi:hypothetical protein